MEDRVRIEPYAVVQPGSKLEAGFQLKAVRKSRSKLVAEKKDPLAMMKALSQQAAAAKAKSSGAAQRDIYKCGQPPDLRLSLSFTAMCVCADALPCASINGILLVNSGTLRLACGAHGAGEQAHDTMAKTGIHLCMMLGMTA